MKTVKNLSFHMFSQFFSLLIPLAELPLITRRLGQHSYGLYVYAISLTVLISIFIDFGFSYSATSKFVKLKKRPNEIAQLIADVFYSKLVLFFITLAPTIIYLLFFATTIETSWIIWILISGLTIGLSPYWYFLANENLLIPIVFDLALRSLGLLSLFLLIHNDTHALKALIIYTTVGILNTLLPSLIMISKTGFGQFLPKNILKTIKESFHFFIYKSSQNINNSMSSVLLGSLHSTAAVGLYSPTEKIVRLIVSLTASAYNVIFPVFSRRYDEKYSIKKHVCFFVAGSFITMSVLSVIIYLFAGTIIQLMFGTGFLGATHNLQGLIWVLPLRVSSIALSLLWFLPTGQERISSLLMISNTIMIAIFSLIFIPTYGTKALVFIILSTETIAFLCLFILFTKGKEKS